MLVYYCRYQYSTIACVNYYYGRGAPQDPESRSSVSGYACKDPEAPIDLVMEGSVNIQFTSLLIAKIKNNDMSYSYHEYIKYSITKDLIK